MKYSLKQLRSLPFRTKAQENDLYDYLLLFTIRHDNKALGFCQRIAGAKFSKGLEDEISLVVAQDTYSFLGLTDPCKDGIYFQAINDGIIAMVSPQHSFKVSGALIELVKDANYKEREDNV
jgi:hypothetical protein